MLHGHERAITQIKYNLEGDLLFSCAKDPQPNVWYSINGERLGTYKGHSGAVWCLDVSCIFCVFTEKYVINNVLFVLKGGITKGICPD